MKQKYSNDEVIAPGTVIISAAGNCSNITKVVEPVLQIMMRKYLLLKLISRCF
jgi:phosphoribosylformylglycinamidine synthase